MKIEQVGREKLKPAEYNPRKMSDEQEKNLMESIKSFGIVDPIIVNKHKGRENIVIGGHQRLKIAEKFKIKKVPVVYVDLNEQREKELNLRLNKNTGEWDWELLKEFDEKFLIDIGFDNNELDKLFPVQVDEDEFDVDKEVGKIEKPIIKQGEIYQLGRHRLMCGNSMIEKDVAKLMDGELGDLVFTDPPYNVNYSYHSRKYHGKTIFNDNMSNEEFEKFLTKVFKNMHKFTKKKMAWYVFCGYSTEPIFRKALDNASFYFQQQLVWIKEHFVMARGQAYHRVYEPFLFGKKKKGTSYKNKEMMNSTDLLDLDFDKFADRLDAWFINRDKVNEYKHPTQKPVRIADRSIRMSSERGAIVIDLFGGGGATLIACEQLDRKCRMMELDPIYAEVIIKRYEKFSNKKAKKLN